jgi:hypothetical protein
VQPIRAHDVQLAAILIGFESNLDVSDLVLPRLLLYHQVSCALFIVILLEYATGSLHPFLNLFSGPGIGGPGTWDDGEDPAVAQDFAAHDVWVRDAANQDDGLILLELKFLWLSAYCAAAAGIFER